jgi:hypothetical protein
MSKKSVLLLPVLILVAIPMTALGFQDRDDGVLTVGEIINIDIETRSLEMESAPIGTAYVPRDRRVHGETAIGIGGTPPRPAPDEPRRVPGDNRGPIPPDDRGIDAIPRPAITRVPLGIDGPLDNLPRPPRQVRRGYRGFAVSTDAQIELREDGRAIDFDSLEVGDRITVLGRVNRETIIAYRITRSLPPEEEGN